MWVSIYIYNPNSGLRIYEDIDGLDQWDQETERIWVDMEGDDPAILSRIANTFSLHELSVEDCLTPGHFPKLEDFGRYLFLIFRSLKPLHLMPEFKVEEQVESTRSTAVDTREREEEEEEENDTERYTRKIAMFLSPSFVVTYRRKEVPWLDALMRQVKQNPDSTLAQSTEVLAHRIIDVLVDRSLRALEFFDKLIDDLEHITIENPDNFDMGIVLETKRSLTTLRQIMRDQRVIINKLANDASLVKDKQRRRYFKDIEDHSIEIINVVDKQIENLIGLRDAYFAIANVKLGDTMKILAVMTTISIPLHLIAGLFGMNIEVMPLINNPNGFWFILAGMLTIFAVMLVFFKTRRWI